MGRMYEVYEGIITALTPIFHGGDEKTGSTPVLRTIYVSTDKYGIIPIPYISGNSIRGRLRRLIIDDLLHSVGYELNNVKLHHVLYSGGILESGSETYAAIDLDLRRQVRNTLPPIALLGCAIGNQMIPGILQVAHMFPFCAEYAMYLPKKWQNHPNTRESVRIYTDESFITRRDELRQERKEDEQAVQMKVNYECFIPGTKFYHQFILRMPTDIEKSCLGRMIALWNENPTIGGRSSSGDGRLRLEYDNLPAAEQYVEWVNKNAEQITAMLTTLEGLL